VIIYGVDYSQAFAVTHFRSQQTHAMLNCQPTPLLPWINFFLYLHPKYQFGKSW
jgi:hypothetical protein